MPATLDVLSELALPLGSRQTGAFTMARAPGQAQAGAGKAEDAASRQAVCGIIMPIAAMLPKYEASHWVDVRRVIDAAISRAGMVPQIVSDSFEGDVIQRRIISNLYDNPVVVCDVSGLNPNVMFELGMRITFKQPVVIITDDYGSIPFDTKVIEHIGYPRDLHIHQTNEFIAKLADRISRLHEQKQSNSFRSFIEEFGTFEVLEPTKKVVEADQFILDRLDSLDRKLESISNRNVPYSLLNMRPSIANDALIILLHEELSGDELFKLTNAARNVWKIGSVVPEMNSGGRHLVTIEVGPISADGRSSVELYLKNHIPPETKKKIATMAWRSQTASRIPDWASLTDPRYQ